MGNNAAVRATPCDMDTDIVDVDDASHHHHQHPLRVGDQLFVRKLVYTASLVVALGIIENVTDATIFDAVKQHEPSIRIFRALFEVVLVLVCCAASIFVWSRYLTVPVTANLLFSSAESPLTWNPTAATAGEDEESDELFNDVHGDDLFLKNKDADSKLLSSRKEKLKKDKADDEQDLELDEQSKQLLLEAEPYDEDDDVTSAVAMIPSALAVLNAALDLLVWILVALILYTVTAIHAVELTNQDNKHVVRIMARIAAPTFPLMLFAFTAMRAVHPWKSRCKLFTIISRTLSAPWYEVTFRDGMIGDVLTSIVRPMQDIAFTVCYVLFGLRGWWSNSYFFPESSQTEREFMMTNATDMFTSSNSFLQAADASVPAMERSWMLHTIILPACMISPLWWRFLQNMRQTYDTKQRWPFLGNALKYFVAAQVAMVGVYQPQMQQSVFWLTSFVAATLYQIYWDLLMDWGLFVRNPRSNSWKLRSQRLYPSKNMYWALAIVNTLLRFCWTLSFVPLRYVSATGVLTNNFSSDTWASILAPTIASAEIIRRTLWGLLRVEWEAIKVRGEESDKYRVVDDKGLEMTPMKMDGGGIGESASSLDHLGLPKLTSDMSSMNNIQVLGELCLYVTAFSILGLIIAAHRGTL